MTEAEWHSSRDPLGMMAFACGRLKNARRLTLLNCGVLGMVTFTLLDKQARRALAVLERLADGPVPLPELREALNWANSSTAQCPPTDTARYFARCALHNFLLPEPQRSFNESGNLSAVLNESAEGLRSTFAAVVRDVFGNPFHPVAFDPVWRSSTALAIAEGIYADRTFNRLPILADALQDAGCEDADILGHLRGDGSHVKGCWALDLVLGKE